MNINELKEKRFKFLNLLYKVTEGDESAHVNMFELGAELDFDRNLTSRVAKYLDGEGLMEFRTLGGGIGISHFGIIEVENSLENPTVASEYFPISENSSQPVNYHLHVGNMHNSQIQQGTQSSNQSMSITENDISEIKELVKNITKYIDDIGLNDAHKSELEAQVATLNGQLCSSQPSNGIISEVLGSIRRVVEGASGNLIATGIITQIGSLLVGGT